MTAHLRHYLGLNEGRGDHVFYYLIFSLPLFFFLVPISTRESSFILKAHVRQLLLFLTSFKPIPLTRREDLEPSSPYYPRGGAFTLERKNEDMKSFLYPAN